MSNSRFFVENHPFESGDPKTFKPNTPATPNATHASFAANEPNSLQLATYPLFGGYFKSPKGRDIPYQLLLYRVLIGFIGYIPA